MNLPPARLCFEDTERREIPYKKCPNAAQHTPSPVDYGGFFTWASRMGKTHVQQLCPGCDRFVIWVPKDQCATCGRLYKPTAAGLVRAHSSRYGRKRGIRCPGTHQPPTEAPGSDQT